MKLTNGWTSIQNLQDEKYDENSTTDHRLKLATATFIFTDFFCKKVQYAVRHFAIKNLLSSLNSKFEWNSFPRLNANLTWKPWLKYRRNKCISSYLNMNRNYQEKYILILKQLNVFHLIVTEKLFEPILF